MSAFADLVRFVPTAGGTTDWVFSTAVGGCQSPALAGVQNGVSYKVYAVSADLTQWEISTGVYSSGVLTFPRTTVLYNSSGTGTATGQSGAGTKISFSTVPQVSVVALKEDLISIEVAQSFTAAQQAQARTNIGAIGPLLLNTLTASGSGQTLIDVTSLTSAYSMYEIEFINLVPATNAVALELFVQSGGTFQQTSYNGATVVTGAAAVITNATTMVQLQTSAGAANTGSGFSGFLRIYNPAGTSAPKMMVGVGAYNNTAGNNAVVQMSSAWNGGNGAVTGFQVQFTSGNIASGAIKVYGYP